MIRARETSLIRAQEILVIRAQETSLIRAQEILMNQIVLMMETLAVTVKGIH